MYTIYLKNGTELQCSSLTFEPHIVMDLESREAFNSVLDSLATENMEIFEVYQDGTRLTGFTDTKLIGIQIVVNSDESWTVHFYLKGNIADSVDPAYRDAFNIMTGEYDA